MTKIGIVYFSAGGHTTKLAEAVEAGAASAEGTEVTVFAIGQDGELPEDIIETLKSFDAIVYGSPTHMGGPAWQFKKFADASAMAWFAQGWNGQVAGGVTVSSSTNGDKASTLSYFQTLAMQHGQVWVGTGQMPANGLDNTPDDVNWTAGFAGAMAIAPAGSQPEDYPRVGDIESARLYGKRIADFTATLRG